METTASSPRVESISTASIGDQPTGHDSLGFSPYVDAIARFLLNGDTRAPLTMSIEGEWGSGKSSFLKQLLQKLEAGIPSERKEPSGSIRVRTVWFNAWRHEKGEALWAAFALEFLDQITRRMSFWERWFAGWKLTKDRFDWKTGWLDAAQFVFVWLTWITMAFAGVYLWCLGSITLDKLVGGKELLSWAMRSGGVFAFVAATFFVVRQASQVFGNPLKHELKKHLKTVDYSDRIAFIERFHRDFGKIVRAYVGTSKVFVFVDDLDRCEVPVAAELMQALNLMIADENPLIFILGMDREKVAAGLAAKHEKLLPYLAREALDEAARGRSNTNAIEYGLAFVEKFIQVPFLVPAPGLANLESFLSSLREVRSLVPESPAAAIRSADRSLSSATKALSLPHPVAEIAEDVDARRWDAFELGVAKDSDAMIDVIRMVAPALDFNPRKLKQFINVFRLRAYVAFDTGLFNPPTSSTSLCPLTFERLAKFVAISLRWPMILNDLRVEPQLLGLLAGDEANDSYVVSRWRKRQLLVELVRFGSPVAPVVRKVLGHEADRFSLVGLEIEQLLRVSPSIKRPNRPDPESLMRDVETALRSNDAQAGVISCNALIARHPTSRQAESVRQLIATLYLPETPPRIDSVSLADFVRILSMYKSATEIKQAYSKLNSEKREALETIFGKEFFGRV